MVGSGSATAEVLSVSAAVQGLSAEAFAQLAGAGRMRRFREGEELMRQSEASGSMFVILTGGVRVVRTPRDLARPVLLAVIGPGDVVGEMGLLDGGPRSATVTALGETVTVEIDAPTLARCVAEHPDLYAGLLRVLSRRLRSTNELVERMARSGEVSDPR